MNNIKQAFILSIVFIFAFETNDFFFPQSLL